MSAAVVTSTDCAAVTDVPETRYAKTDDGLNIAYQTLGDGPRDIVLALAAHCGDMMWEEPSFAYVLHRMARIGRLICLDYRGFGGSDPVPLGALPTPETWMEDTRVVLDAVGSQTAHLVCHGASGFLGILFAATYPERTNTLTLIEATARTLRDEDYPIGIPPDVTDRFAEGSEQLWGTGGLAAVWAPSRADDEAFRRWSGRFERGAASPAMHGALVRWVINLDLRAVLPTIRVSTLVLHHESSRMIPLDHGRYLADHIDGASLVVLPGCDYWFFSEGADEIVDRIEEFITGVPPMREPDRALATVLFTDIVASTEAAARLGDKQWMHVLNQHDVIVNRELDRHRGRKVNPTGDGVLATFDGPARAVRCAQSISEAVRRLGIEVRAGLHTGEVELRGEDIGGIAVHIGQRVSALAGPGEVLVSRTVVDLVAGSGIEFDDRGEHELKGVPGTWKLFAVAP
ncbi:MAG: adenylate/guanylate cyclase domain-containing protein [Acidimicrobiales bacterium]